MKSRQFLTLVSTCVLVAVAVAPGWAQDQTVPEDGGKQQGGFREQTIYIPYEKLHKVFEKQGRGVFLPYEEFMELWSAAREKVAPPTEARPPVDSLVTEVSGEVTVAKDVVSVTAKVKIELMKKGWHEVPLALGDVAISKATIAGKPARLVSKGDKGYAVLLHNPGDGAIVFELDLAFAKAYDRTPGRNRVTFAAPQAPVSRWDVRIPEPGVEVEVRPFLAATEASDAAENETRVLAFVGATPAVHVEWTPKAEGAKGLEALASVRSEQRVWIEEGVVRTRAEFAYSISRAELAQLTIAVPADQKIVNVFDANVREWQVTDGNGTQRIEAQLFEPAKEKQSLVVELERIATEERVSVPAMEALGVSRQRGTVVVSVGDELRAEAVAREGLLQLDAAKLPELLRNESWDFAYQYAALPFTLTFSIEKIEPRILADVLVEAHLHPDSLVLDALFVCDVQRTGVFQFSVRMPADCEVRNVRGAAVGTTSGADVETHHFVEGEAGLMVVNLARQAKGKSAFAMQLHRRLNDVNLLRPTGEAAAIDVVIPRLDSATVARESGRLAIYSPESLRVDVAHSTGLRAIAHAEAVKGLRSTQNSSGSENAVMSFAYTDEPVTLGLEAERRKPHITARQLLWARIESGVVKYAATFDYDIRYSGVRQLSVCVPASVAGRARVVSPGIRKSVAVPPAVPTDLPDGYELWLFSGEAEFSGKHRVRMLWEQELAELDIGRGVEITVPRLFPHSVDRDWGQVVLAKTESIDVVPTERRDGLRGIDPQYDLMEGADVSDAALAFEFHDAWELAVKATRYEAQDVKATSIERGLVRMVLTRSDVTSVQAVYRMRSARQRLVIQLPGAVEFDTQPLRLNGRPASLEQGGAGEYYVPLVGLKQDEPFLLELRYVLSGMGTQLQCPVFPNEPATQQVFLSAFFPQEWAYLGSTGPWNDEFVWVVTGFTSWPRTNHSSDWLIGWVTEEVNADKDSLNGFATDGRHALFSTLRPAQDESAALRLCVLRRTWLNLLVLVVGVGIGLALVPAHAGWRILVCGAVAVALLVMAVFWPSFARALVTNASASGATVVLLVWLMQYLLVRRPAALAARPVPVRVKAMPPPPPTPGPPAVEEETEPEHDVPPEIAEEEADDSEGGKDDE